MNEFFFIRKECGWSDAVFYILYKVKLKLKSTPFFVKLGLSQTARIEKIYDVLAFKTNPLVDKNGKQYIRKKLFNQQNGFVKLRLYSSDSKVFEQIFIHEQYKTVVEIYQQLFSCEPKHIFDCGANIGLTTIYLSSYFPSAFYTLVEPFKGNLNMIRENLGINGIRNYKLFEGGVWNKSSTLYINRNYGDGKEWSISLTESSSPEETVTAYSLLDLLNAVKSGVDILKIDVEGAEKILFEDLNYAAAFLNIVKCVAIEIHDEPGVRKRIYNAFTINNFFYYNNGELTIAINRSLIK